MLEQDQWGLDAMAGNLMSNTEPKFNLTSSDSKSYDRVIEPVEKETCENCKYQPKPNYTYPEICTTCEHFYKSKWEACVK